MKNIIFLILFVVSNTAFSQFTKEEFKSIRKTIGKGVRFKYDNHKGIIWVQSKVVKLSTSGSTYFYLYYGLEKENDKIVRLPIRVKSRLYSSGWIFANEVSFALLKYKEEDKGQVAKANYFDNEPVRDVVSGGYVSEVLENVIPVDVITLIKYSIENRRMITIRFIGEEKYSEEILFASQLKGLTMFFDTMNKY